MPLWTDWYWRQILLYLTPVPNRGKRNSSQNLPYVVMAIAEIKGITTKEVEDITWENAVKKCIGCLCK